MISNQSFSNKHSRNSSTSSSYSTLSDFADSLHSQSSDSNLNTFNSNSMTFNQKTVEPQSTLNQFDSSNLPYSSQHHTTHSRKSSVSGSDTSESHHSVHSNSSYTSGGGSRAVKRVSSSRQARSDASPYARDYQSASQAGSSSEKSVDELAQLFRNTMEYNSSNEGSQYGEEEEEDGEDEEDEEDCSGRSSRSSNDEWDIYIPGGGEKLSKQLDGFEGESFSGPHGTQTMMHSGRDPQEVVAVLDQLAGDVSSAQSGTARDKARSTFLQSWLGCSYELCEEGNASRQALYGCYAHSCEIYRIKPINSAGFGKAVRQKFVDIKTRRLGQRGASRYHYCGIRPTNAQEASLLVRLTKEEAKDDPSPSLEGPRIKHQRSNSSNNLPATPSTARPNLDSSSSQDKKPRTSKSHAGHKSLSISVPLSRNNSTSRHDEINHDSMNTAVPNPVEPSRNFVDLSLTLPGFPSIDELSASGGSYASLDPETTRVFWREFSDHSRAIIDAVRSFRFDQFELIVRTWWTSMDQSKRILVQNPAISALIYRSDAAVYDDILEFLNSQLTVPMVPQAFSSLRVLGENMERIQTVALAAFDGMPFTSPKIELAARFGHLITRHLGLCQLVQALTGIISNPLTMNEMLLAWSTIDLESIKNQSALVSNCDHRLLSECFAGFESLIQNVGSVQNVIQWLQLCFQGCLAQSQGSRQISPRSLLLRWSFVASQIMRDLTLRSAPAFGSYQIFGLFFEELLSMQVLRQVALQITAINPLASGTNVPFPPQHVELQAMSPMVTSYPMQLNVNPTVSINSPYKDDRDGYNGTSGMNDHLSLLDQFSPKTSEMLRQFSEVNPVSPGTFALYDDSTSYSALPPTPHGFSSFPDDSLDFNRSPQHFSSLGARSHFDAF